MEAYEFKGKDIQWLTMMIDLLQGSCSNINSKIRDKHILYMYVIQEIISRNVSISITEKNSLLFIALKLSHNFASFRRPKNFCSSVSAQFAEKQTWLITHFQLRSVALAAFSCWNSIEIFIWQFISLFISGDSVSSLAFGLYSLSEQHLFGQSNA